MIHRVGGLGLESIARVLVILRHPLIETIDFVEGNAERHLLLLQEL